MTKKPRKSTFYKNKTINTIENININNILVSKKVWLNTLLDTMTMIL